MDHTRYATYLVEKYLDTATIKEISKLHNTALPHDMMFTKEDDSTSDEQVEVLSREYNIHYMDFAVSLISLLST